MLRVRTLADKLNKSYDEICKLRRAFHRIPEPGMKEYKTTALIEEELLKLGIKPQRLEPTGLIAYIGPVDSYTIALRADIDGLMVTECADLDFPSEHPGYMHACGHDGHIAGLLAAAKLLKEQEAELEVRVKLIFQPSEENAHGAAHILKQNILSDVDEIFGLHLFTDIPLGQISVEEGPRMAQTDRFAITFTGSGGHAGKPHQCIDATVMAADFVMSSQTIVAREVNPLDSAVVTIGHLESGTQYNIISGQARLEGTCRSFSESVASHLKDGLTKRAEGIACYYGGSAEVDYDYGAHPPVINDPAMTKRLRDSVEGVLGHEMLVMIPKLMLGEDFSWYQTMVPGVFAFVGCGNEEKGYSYPNHHPKFMIDEEALIHAAVCHLCAVSSAEEYVKEKRYPK